MVSQVSDYIERILMHVPRVVLAMFFAILLAWGLVRSEPKSRAADESDGAFGTIMGQFVVDGMVPPQRVLVAKGDAKINDAAICAAADLLSDELLVDAETGGIANVFIYLPKAAKIAPKLKSSPVKEVEFDQKGCRFIPHVLFVRTDQTVVVKSADGCSHNTKFASTRNDPFNFSVPGNERKGTPVKLKLAEKQPVPVECSIHNWMRAHWLILDHPYAAISDPQGQFTITDLPAGEHQFTIWHEMPGYVDRTYKVTVKAGQVVDLGKIVIPAAKLTGK
jgi:hypothetical protein